MIIKSFETNKINFNNSNLLLFYGKNEGLKNYAVKDIIKDKNNVYSYDEKEVLDNLNFFFETVLSKSLFEKEKIIIIKRATDKIVKIIEEKLSHIKETISLSIIGCVVNGPGEARETNIGITGGGKKFHQIYIDGNVSHRMEQKDFINHVRRRKEYTN